MATIRQLMLRYGRYSLPGDFFYHRLWHDRLREIGFVVTCLEKLDAHHVWRIRLRGTLKAQAHLLVSQPVGKKALAAENPMVKQLELQIRRIAAELGSPIRQDHLEIEHSGKTFQISFIWPMGNPGRLRRTEKRPDAFCFHVRAWVRRNRN